MQGVGHADVLLYFKYPTTKQMRCPVNAYKNAVIVNQKLNTFASAARSMRWGPPSSIMLEKNLFSST